MQYTRAKILYLTGCSLIREICFFFKVREKPRNSVKCSGKLENLQKSGNSKIMFCSNPSKIEKTDI